MTNGQERNFGDYPSRLEEANNPFYDGLQAPRVYPGKPPVVDLTAQPQVAPELEPLITALRTAVVPDLCECICRAAQRLATDSMILVKNPMWVEPPARSLIGNLRIDALIRGIIIPAFGAETTVVGPIIIPDRHIGVVAFIGQLLAAAADFNTIGWRMRINGTIVPGYGDQVGGTGFFFQLGDPTNLPSCRLPVPIILPPRSTFLLTAQATGAGSTAGGRVGGWMYESNMASDIISAMGGGHGTAGACATPAYSGRVVR